MIAYDSMKSSMHQYWSPFSVELMPLKGMGFKKVPEWEVN